LPLILWYVITVYLSTHRERKFAHQNFQFDTKAFQTKRLYFMGSASSTLTLEDISSSNIAAYIGSIGPFEQYKDQFLVLQVDGKKLKEYTESNSLHILFSDLGIEHKHEETLKHALGKLASGQCVHPFLEKWDGV
jgi:hypothetical protein